MPHIIGLTGGIASGKSTVASIWAASDAYIIDADAIAREVVQPGKPALYLIRRHFGPDVINSDGTLDRAALGRIIFSDGSARVALNRRIHPFIILTMLSRLLRAACLLWYPVIVMDAPLLYESKTLVSFCSRVVVVSCTTEQQVERMLKRDSEKGVTEEDARKRLKAQMPLEEKVRRADVVIDNSTDIEELEGKAMHVLEKLRPSAWGERTFRILTCAVAAKVTLSVIVGLTRNFRVLK